jgi:four helix bundle protein
MQFPHEKLMVYQKALEFFGDIQRFVSSWSKQHAFVDHLSRAMESILFNLVEAVRIGQSKKKLLTMDYAVGSSFECAACLDIAVLKGLLDPPVAVEKKMQLLELCRMLIGLRNSWKAPRVAEDSVPYASGQNSEASSRVFHHENLDMYNVSLDFYRWFISTEPGKALSSVFEKTCDTLTTRMVLNIAEGNGRYAELSRQTFLDTANAAAVKLAACLDVGLLRGVWKAPEVERGKHLLLRVGQMTARKDYAE